MSARGNLLLQLFAVLMIACVPARAESIVGALGTAALIGAATPIGLANIQANADQNISAMQARQSMYTVDKTTGLSLNLATMQSQTQLALAAMQANLNGYNQGQTTLRLQMQLDAMERARQQNMQANLYALDQEYSWKNRLLDFQMKTQQMQAALSQVVAGGSPFVFQNIGQNVPTSAFGAVSDRLISSIQTTSASTVPQSTLSRGVVAGSSRTNMLLTPVVATASVRPAPARALVGSWPRHAAPSASLSLPSGHAHGHSAH